MAQPWPLGVDQVFGLHAEELLHLREPLAGVIDVMNRRRQRLAGRLMRKRHAQINHPHAVEHVEKILRADNVNQPPLRASPRRRATVLEGQPDEKPAIAQR